MYTKKISTLALSLLILGGTGCTEIAKNPYVSQFIPTIAFDGLQVNSVTFQEVDTNFLFSIDNPNPVGIDIEEFSYSLAFADMPWMDGDNPDGLLLGASGASSVALPTHIVFADLYDMVLATRGMDTIGFQLGGDFGLRLDSSTLVTEEQTMDTASSDADVLYLPYDVDGDFPALRKPKISLKKIKLQSLSLSELRFNLVLDVDNEHASNLIFQRFSYDLQMGNASLISGIADNLEEIVTGGDESTNPNRIVRIPIQVNSLSVISGLWDMLRGGQQMNIGFVATSDVDTPFGLMSLDIDETGDVSIETQ